MARTKREKVEMLEEKGVTCCYARADKFWVRDADGMPWEMYFSRTLKRRPLRRFLGQELSSHRQNLEGNRLLCRGLGVRNLKPFLRTATLDDLPALRSRVARYG
jgi:hypothetical protein